MFMREQSHQRQVLVIAEPQKHLWEIKGKAEGGQGQEECYAATLIWKSIDLLSKKNLKYKEIELFKSSFHIIGFFLTVRIKNKFRIVHIQWNT